MKKLLAVDCTVKLLKVREVEREVAYLPAASIFVICLGCERRIQPQVGSGKRICGLVER